MIHNLKTTHTHRHKHSHIPPHKLTNMCRFAGTLSKVLAFIEHFLKPDLTVSTEKAKNTDIRMQNKCRHLTFELNTHKHWKVEVVKKKSVRRCYSKHQYESVQVKGIKAIKGRKKGK